MAKGLRWFIYLDAIEDYSYFPPSNRDHELMKPDPSGELDLGALPTVYAETPTCVWIDHISAANSHREVWTKLAATFSFFVFFNLLASSFKPCINDRFIFLNRLKRLSCRNFFFKKK